MRIYDTEIKHQGDGWILEITEYHDEREGLAGPRRWHARVVILDDSSPKVLNFNRDTPVELHRVLESFKDVFETATTAVIDAAAVS